LGVELFRSIDQWFDSDADIGIVDHDYLALGSRKTDDTSRELAAMQNSLGADIAVLSPADTQSRSDFLNM